MCRWHWWATQAAKHVSDLDNQRYNNAPHKYTIFYNRAALSALWGIDQLPPPPPLSHNHEYKMYAPRAYVEKGALRPHYYYYYCYYYEYVLCST